jgi:hypothetical protein
LAIEGFTGVTAIEVKIAAVADRLVEPVTPAWIALMVVLPTPVPVTSP